MHTAPPQTTRTLFLHAETVRALLVSPAPIEHDQPCRWVPKSRVEVTLRRPVYNRLYGTDPAIALILGSVVTMRGSAELFDRLGLPEDADMALGSYSPPAAGQCPHGEPISLRCDDCRREHARVTA